MKNALTSSQKFGGVVNPMYLGVVNPMYLANKTVFLNIVILFIQKYQGFLMGDYLDRACQNVRPA
jgi:hypothetical protein